MITHFRRCLLVCIVVLLAFCGPLRSEEKVVLSEQFIGIEDFVELIGDSASTDYHINAKVVAAFMKQISDLESKKQRSPDEDTLLRSMLNRDLLRNFAAFSKVNLENYKDKPLLHPESRRTDLASLDEAVKKISNRLSPQRPTSDPFFNIKFAKVEGEDAKKIESFLIHFRDLIKAEKYLEIARNELQFQEKIPADKMSIALPKIVETIEEHVRDGCPQLLDELLLNREHWYWLSDKRNEVVVVSDLQVKGSIRLKMSDSGTWKCAAIWAGNLAAFKTYKGK